MFTRSAENRVYLMHHPLHFSWENKYCPFKIQSLRGIIFSQHHEGSERSYPSRRNALWREADRHQSCINSGVEGSYFGIERVAIVWKVEGDDLFGAFYWYLRSLMNCWQDFNLGDKRHPKRPHLFNARMLKAF